MNNQDPIADMLTRIRNANRVGRRLVLIPNSKICGGIAQVLKDEGYIEEFDKIDRTIKPGCRIYRKVGDLPNVLNGMGIIVVSTSKGVMSDRRARENNVG